jgi:hypothetical protein
MSPKANNAADFVAGVEHGEAAHLRAPPIMAQCENRAIRMTIGSGTPRRRRRMERISGSFA